MPDFISYLRVSTKKQGASGLGLAAQRAAVAQHVTAQQGQVIREFVEVESGKRHDNRPQLQLALATAKRSGATLVVAKLDRLARNVAFTSALMESGVDFVCCDNPNASRFTIHILAAVAEHEREQISARTKAAFAAGKAKGRLYGSAQPGFWAGREHLRLAALERGRQTADQRARDRARKEYADLEPIMRQMRDAGQSWEAIAAFLNARGDRTRTGKPFRGMQVLRILRRGEQK